MPVLRGFYRDLTVRFNSIAVTANHADDNYERMSKGIMAYNAGRGHLTSGSWVRLLMILDPAADRDINLACSPLHTYPYSIEIKEGAGIVLRTYRWQWTVTSSEAVASTTYTVGQTFCFDYGEADWFASTTWQSVRNSILAGSASPVSCTVGVTP